MKILKTSRFYAILFLVVSLVLAYTTFHLYTQSSKNISSSQQRIDSDFLSSLNDMNKAIKNLPNSPDTTNLQQLQNFVSKTSALVAFTSYSKKEVYLNSVMGQLNNLVLNFESIPISVTDEFKNEWHEWINKIEEDPTNIENLNSFNIWMSELRNS